MRIWDVDPGYLNRQSLLGEHRELHAIHVILSEGRSGYARHPETLRWQGCLGGLWQRHRLLVAEMELRGYQHQSPLPQPGNPCWPEVLLDPPARQLARLAAKYRDREPGRIPLPTAPRQLWAQHKYSTMARSPRRYRELGPRVAAGAVGFADLAAELLDILRRPPPAGRLQNALDHMWGYVDHLADAARLPSGTAPAELLAAVQRLAMAHGVTYLIESTALAELAAWLPQAASPPS